MKKRGGSEMFLEREVQIMRLRDILIFIPVFSFFVFISPLIDAAAPETKLFGIPLKFALIFMFWGCIILAIALTNRLIRQKLNERVQ